jgi:MFS family permease
MVTTIGAAMLMQKIGRRAGFAIGGLSAAAGGIISILAVGRADFWLFCLGTFIAGAFQGFAQFYALAAADSVRAERRSRAISTVLAGGLVAAIAGPLLAAASKDWIPGVPFAGAYGLVTALGLASSVLVLALLRDVEPATAAIAQPARPLARIARQPAFISGVATTTAAFAAMVLVMTAAPLAAVACSYSVADGAGIIQWHLVGMFAPSLFAGRLVERFGLRAVQLAGVGLIGLCLVIATSSTSLPAFYAALFCLGFGWNLMMVCGTTLIASSYRPAERGRTQAVAGLVQNLASAGAALSAGALLDAAGWVAVNVAALPMLAAGLAALIYWTLKRPAAGIGAATSRASSAPS